MNDFSLGILILCVLLLAVAGTYIRKLLNESDAKDKQISIKDQAIIGLREIIRLLEDKQK